MPARWLPALGLTLEHVRCLRAVARGQPLSGSTAVMELVECGFIEAEQQDRLVLTPAGKRYLRLTTIDSSRSRRARDRDPDRSESAPASTP